MQSLPSATAALEGKEAVSDRGTPRRRLGHWLIAIGQLTAAFPLLFWGGNLGRDQLVCTACFALLSGASAYVPIKGNGQWLTTASVALVATAVLLPPPAALVVVGLGVLTDIAKRGFLPFNQFFNFGNLLLAVSAPAFLSEQLGLQTSGASLALRGGIAIVGFGMINSCLNGLSFALSFRVPFLKTGNRQGLLIEFLLGACGVSCAVAYTGNASLVLFALAPIGIAQQMLRVPRLEQESRTDPKSGLLNMRAFGEEPDRAVDRAVRYGEALSFIAIDMDHLRELNTAHGHSAADSVIEFVAQTIRGELRNSDIAARFGGDEFVVLLPQTVLDAAVDVAERIRVAVSAAPHGLGRDKSWSTTISAGVAQWSAPMLPAELLEAADAALYEAKALGRNGVAGLIASVSATEVYPDLTMPAAVGS